jgi:hypothetical protein
MTAEIALLNRSAVVLAADSALTVGERVHADTNKLFSLSAACPIGIMVYGNASFVGVPWETVIKLFRAEFGDKAYKTVSECVDDFVAFLKRDRFGGARDDFVYRASFILFCLEALAAGIDPSLKGIAFRKALREAIAEDIKVISGGRNAFGERDFGRKELLDRDGDILDALAADVFGGRHIPRSLRNEIADDIVCNLFSHITTEQDSGVVIAGFGIDQLFPATFHITVDGKYHGRLRHLVDELYDANETPADEIGFLSAFAQRDIIYLFMEG